MQVFEFERYSACGGRELMKEAAKVGLLLQVTVKVMKVVYVNILPRTFYFRTKVTVLRKSILRGRQDLVARAGYMSRQVQAIRAQRTRRSGLRDSGSREAVVRRA